MKKACAIALVLLHGTAAVAQGTCPTKDDLAIGIIREEVGSARQYHYQRRPDGIYFRQHINPDGNPSGAPVITQHPLTLDVTLGRNEERMPNYSADVTALDRLDEIKTWTTDVRIAQSDAHKVITITYLGREVRTVGTCRYTVWFVQTEINENGKETKQISFYYAPDLGLAVEYLPSNASVFLKNGLVASAFEKASAPLPYLP